MDFDRARIVHQVDRFRRSGVGADDHGKNSAVFTPGGQRHFLSVTEEEEPFPFARIELADELLASEKRGQRVVDRVDRLGIEITGHHAVVVFAVIRVVAVVAQVVPVVADCSPAPGVDQLLVERHRLRLLVAAGGGQRGFVGPPGFGDAGALPHRQKTFLHHPHEMRVEIPVFVIGVDVVAAFAESERILLISRLPQHRMVGERGKSAGQDPGVGIARLDCFVRIQHHLRVRGRAEAGEGGDVRLVPDLPEADPAAIALRHFPAECLPRLRFRFGFLRTLRAGVAGGPRRAVAEDRLKFDALFRENGDGLVEGAEIPLAAGWLHPVPVDVFPHDFGADQRGRQRFELLNRGRMELGMGRDPPEEAFRLSGRRAGRFEAGEGALFRHLSAALRKEPEPDIPVAGGRERRPDRTGHRLSRRQFDGRQFFGEGASEEIFEDGFGLSAEPGVAGVAENEAELIRFSGREHMNRIAGLDFQADVVGGGRHGVFRNRFGSEKQRLSRAGLPFEIDRETLQCDRQVELFVVVSAPGGVFVLHQVDGVIHGEDFRLCRRQAAQLILEDFSGCVNQPQTDAADRCPGR